MSKLPALPAEEYSRRSKVEENFQVLKKYVDHRFGPVSIIAVPSIDRKLMVREKSFGSRAELTTEIQAAKKRLAVYDPHLLALVDYSTGERSDFCASFYWIKLFFEFPDHDIEQEIRRRAKYNLLGFNGTELTHMLYNTVQGGAVLNKNGLYHGDVCPSCVEMDNPQSYKLVERFGDLAKPEEVQQTRLIRGEEIYSAPENYARFKFPPKGKVTPINQKTADVFSLGMTLLHAGTDEGVQGCYSKNGTLDYSRLEKLKSDFAARFPENNLLVTTVMAMLQVDPANRPPDFEAMEKELPPYPIVQQALAQLPQMPIQGGRSAIQPNLSPSQAYNQYVSQNQWEHSWNAPFGAASVPHPHSQGVLGKDLHLPQENHNAVVITKPPVQPPQHFGVVPPLGQGLSTYAPPNPNQPQLVAQPGAGLQPNLPPAVLQYAEPPRQSPAPPTKSPSPSAPGQSSTQSPQPLQASRSAATLPPSVQSSTVISSSPTPPAYNTVAAYVSGQPAPSK